MIFKSDPQESEIEIRVCTFFLLYNFTWKTKKKGNEVIANKKVLYNVVNKCF